MAEMRCGGHKKHKCMWTQVVVTLSFICDITASLREFNLAQQCGMDMKTEWRLCLLAWSVEMF